jgi:hypothetical protein
MFTGRLPSSGHPSVARVRFTGICLPSRCLEMGHNTYIHVWHYNIVCREVYTAVNVPGYWLFRDIVQGFRKHGDHSLGYIRTRRTIPIQLNSYQLRKRSP